MTASPKAYRLTVGAPSNALFRLWMPSVLTYIVPEAELSVHLGSGVVVAAGTVVGAAVLTAVAAGGAALVSGGAVELSAVVLDVVLSVYVGALSVVARVEVSEAVEKPASSLLSDTGAAVSAAKVAVDGGRALSLAFVTDVAQDEHKSSEKTAIVAALEIERI